MSLGHTTDTTVSHAHGRGDQSAVLGHLASAFDAFVVARRQGDPRTCDTANERLERAVRRARDVDVSWQSIGDVLGMRRGNAQRLFRERSR